MSDSRPLVTVLRHNDHVPPGRFGPWLEDAGVRLRLVALDAGEPVPALSDLGEGLLVLGGSMNALADAEHPYLPAERALIAEAVDSELPVFGICLGHQLLGAALGGRVEVGAAAGPERGATEVTWAPAAADDPVLGPLARAGERLTVTEFHDDAVVEPPPGARVLASSARHRVQAFRVGSATGVQFHPEATASIVRGWAERTESLAPADVEEIVAGTEAVDAQVAAGGRALAQAFAAQVRAAAGRG